MVSAVQHNITTVYITSAQGSTVPGGVKVGEDGGVGLRVALDVTNQAEVDMILLPQHKRPLWRFKNL